MSRALVAAAAMPPKKKGKRGLPPGALYHTERKYFKLLFCGKEFPAGAEETRRALEKEEAVGNCEFRFVQCAREDVAREIVDADIAVPLMTKIDDTLLSKANNLKLVLQFGVGLEGVDEEACTKRGILLARIPSEKTGNADSTAEMAVYLLLAALRRVNQLARSLEDRKLGEPCTVQLKGKIVTIVGWGHIGKEVARRLRSFKCKLQAARKSEWPKEEQDFLLYDEEVRPLDDIKWIKNSDAVVICANQTKENMGMINDEFMSHMKPGSVLVNIARGGLFNKTHVLNALNDGRLGYLASDVAWQEPVDPADPLVSHERAYFTPHVGGVTDASYQCMGAIVAKTAWSLQADPWLGETTVVGLSPELRYMVDEIMLVNANLPVLPGEPKGPCVDIEKCRKRLRC